MLTAVQNDDQTYFSCCDTFRKYIIEFEKNFIALIIAKPLKVGSL